uniref:NADH-ubiquinone oxidoreductase chain 4 n=1 Tax=Chaetocnema scheffleri TaxID=1425543 RepID=A0A1P8NMW2_9CUCU|nr:NADH dehydrogenase subunit 4 [Chaetocnema scheffleri]
MMKFLFMLLMLMPIYMYNFWLNLWFLFIMIFMFMMNYYCLGIFSEISYFMGCDLLSYSLILLSYYICCLMILASEKIKKEKNYYNFFNFIIIFMLLSLFLVFTSMNLFLFYLFFEISLIPTLILIIGWGYQPERLEAGIYLLFYTMFMSLPMFIIIMYMYMINGSLNFMLLNLEFNNMMIYLMLNMVFFVKVPMYFLHLWLPKAHVEAPISGSMILAGVMLKLGGYGLMRLLFLFQTFINSMNVFIMMICMIGGLIVSLICIRQSDMKSLIAYSSVAHMGMVLGGIMTLSYWGMWGSLVMMLAHGLCSSGLFCLVNLMYERSLSRSLYLNKGLINILPSLSLWWFLLLSSNMAFPPSLNLFGEIMLINSLISFSWLNMLMLSFISFMSGAYSLFIYSYSQHGYFYSGLFSYNNINIREYLLMILHWVPLNLLFLKMEILCIWI